MMLSDIMTGTFEQVTIDFQRAFPLGIADGASGYLYSLLSLNKMLTTRFSEELADSLKELHRTIERVAIWIGACILTAKPLLNVNTTETCYKNKYNLTVIKEKRTSQKGCIIDGKGLIGAGNGTVGVLYMVLKAIEDVPQLNNNKKFIEVIE